MTPELQLVIAAAPARPSDAARTSIERLAALPLDWNRVLELAARHAVRPGLLRNLIPHLPRTQLESLRGQCDAIRAHNLFLAGELLRVLSALDAGGISAIAFKGPVLAHTLYADLGRREFNDLDLLVPRDAVWNAVEVLAFHGYKCTLMPGGRIRDAFLGSECEVMLVHPAGHTIDLHWDFTASYYRPFPLSPPASPAVEQLSGVPVRTLSLEDAALFAIGHLSRHGSWSVKESAEIVSLLQILSDGQWERILARAARHNCRRMVLFAVALASHMHQIAPPPPFASVLEPLPRWLETLLSRNTVLLAETTAKRPGALARLDLRLRQIDTPASRLAHATRFFLAPRPRVWQTCPRFASLIHQVLQGIEADPHPLP